MLSLNEEDTALLNMLSPNTQPTRFQLAKVIKQNRQHMTMEELMEACRRPIEWLYDMISVPTSMNDIMEHYEVVPDNHPALKNAPCWDDYKGMIRVRYCSQQHMVDVLRCLFKLRDKHLPFLCPTTRQPHVNWEGCKMSSWSDSKVTFTQAELGLRTFEVTNIYKLLVSKYQ